MARAHSLSALIVALISSLVLDALVHAPDAGGPLVMESTVGAILESGSKLGRVMITYIPVPICLPFVCGLMGTMFCLPEGKASVTSAT